MDFRLTKLVYKFAKSIGIKKDYDLITIGGGIKSLVKPKDPNDKNFLMRQIAISVELHEIKKIIIISHEDCGAYGGKKAFESDEIENKTHQQDTEQAKQIILEKYPNLEIEIKHACLKDNKYFIE